MREADDSPFMSLPMELRFHIYDYLVDFVYQPVFSEPCICSWEVYQIPTALLQLNKTIYEEVKHPSIQKPLQRANDQLSPKIVLGPTRTVIDPVYIALSDIFHRAGKQLHTSSGGPRERGNEVENIGLELASWYNDIYLPQQVPSGHEEAFDTQTECRPERLHKFVQQTLKRMVVKKTCEIRIRLLVHPKGLPSKAPLSCYIWYEAMAAVDTTRRALSPEIGRELKIVYRSPNLKSSMAPMYDHYQKRRWNIKAAEAHERDRGLFDMAGVSCWGYSCT